jgi:hypothetical protein
MTLNDFNNWLQSLSSEEHDYALAYEHYWLYGSHAALYKVVKALYKISKIQAHDINIIIQDYYIGGREKNSECLRHILRDPLCEDCMADEEKDQNND